MRLHVESLGMRLHLEESGNEATWGRLSTYPSLIPIFFSLWVYHEWEYSFPGEIFTKPGS